MAEKIIPSDYAKLKGVSRAAISQKIKAGILTIDADGKLDPDIADAEWEAAKKQLRPEKQEKKTIQDAAQQSFDYQQARAKRETHEANIAEMKEKELAGDLVRVADVEFSLEDLGAILLQRLQQIPPRLTPVLAAESDPAKVGMILTNELNAVIDELREIAENKAAEFVKQNGTSS